MSEQRFCSVWDALKTPLNKRPGEHRSELMMASQEWVKAEELTQAGAAACSA